MINDNRNFSIPFIHTYKYDEAVSDEVILDLRYDARKIEQELTSPQELISGFV